MRRLLLVACWAVAFSWMLPAARAETPPDPLRLVPAEADFLLKVERPRALVETVLNLDVVQQLQTLEAFQELTDSTKVRRFKQFVGYYEQSLGGRWPELIERLAGGGIVVASKIGDNPAPALLVVQSKDEALLRKFVQTVRQLIEQELAREEAKERLQQGSYRNLETYRIGKDFHAAVAGSALLVSNNEKALQLGLDRHFDNGKLSLATVASVAEARQLLPPDAFAWTWLNLDTVRKQPGAKETLNPDATDPNLTVLFGGWLDQFRRAPFLCAGLAPRPNGLQLSFRTSRGREGMSEGLAALHLPSADLGGALPLLEPKGVLFSASYVLDVHQFWERRAKIFNADQVKKLEEFDESSGKILGGKRLNSLLTQAGPQQRWVVTLPSSSEYRTKPAEQYPAFAFVVGMRDSKEFSRNLEIILRTAALGASFTQLKIKLVEEKHGDLTIVGYRFAEDQPLEGDVNNVRFNFSPCFVAVGNQYVIASTMALAHELIDVLQKEAQGPVAKNQAAMQMKFYPAGAADFLQSIEDRLLAETILDRALAPSEARDQVRKFIELVRRAGALEVQQTYGAQDFRYDLQYALPKR